MAMKRLHRTEMAIRRPTAVPAKIRTSLVRGDTNKLLHPEEP
jgi:hypothetical protein